MTALPVTLAWLDTRRTDPGADEALLSAAERGRAEAMRDPARRRRFTARRAALRRLLAARTGTPAAGLALATTPAGRPYLPGAPLAFSLSQADELAVIALAEAPALGLDAEAIDPGAACPRLAARFLGPGLPAPGSLGFVRAFFEGWTLLEARLKAIGTGLSSYDPAAAAAGVRGAWHHCEPVAGVLACVAAPGAGALRVTVAAM